MIRTLIISFAFHLSVLLLAFFLLKPDISAHGPVIAVRLVTAPASKETIDSKKTRDQGLTHASLPRVKLKGDRRQNLILDNNVQPTPDLSVSPDQIESKVVNLFENEEAKQEKKTKSTRQHEASAWSARIKRNGTVKLEDNPLFALSPTGFTTDLTDVVMRLRGDSLYDAQKRKFLNETREMREEMAREAKHENLAQALVEIRDRLNAVWNDTELSLIEKKKRLFEIWDECAEDDSEEVRNTTMMIRVSISTFINNKLAQNSEGAYSNEELLELNNNSSSKARFLPYN